MRVVRHAPGPGRPYSVKRITPQYGAGAGQKNEYAPMEEHPDWQLFSGGGPSPTIYKVGSNSVFVTRSNSADYALMYIGYGEVGDVDMSFTITYENDSNAIAHYPIAKGTDFDHFVGVSIWQGEVMIVEHVDGSWNRLIEVPAAGTLGKVCRMTIVGDVATLFIDGAEMGGGTTIIPRTGYMGMFVRACPGAMEVCRNFSFQGQKAEAVTYHGDAVTHNTLPVTYNG